MKKLLLCASLLALVGCASPQQKAETTALKAVHKAEWKVNSKTVNFTAATALQASTLLELTKAKTDLAEKEKALEEVLGYKVKVR